MFPGFKMLLRLLLNVATYGSLASATTVTSVSWTSTSTCSYKLETGGVPPSMHFQVSPKLPQDKRGY